MPRSIKTDKFKQIFPPEYLESMNRHAEVVPDFEKKVEKVIADAGLSFGNEDAIWGENGPDEITGERFLYRQLTIRDRITLKHPEGADYGVKILCKKIVFEESGELLSDSDIVIFAYEGDGFITITNTHGKAGGDGHDIDDVPNSRPTAPQGSRGNDGRKAFIRCTVWPPDCDRHHATGGGHGGNGSTGQKGIAGALGGHGETGIAAGNVTFLCEEYGAASIVEINALGGDGGNGGRGGKGGKGGRGGRGGDGGKGGDGQDGLSAKDGGKGGRGGNGGRGGRGGDGGSGADGGRGGDVTLLAVNPHALPVMEAINNRGGDGGQGGAGGMGGEGGAPGSGGSGGPGGHGWFGGSRGGNAPAGGGGSGGVGGPNGNPGDDGDRGQDGDVIRRPRREVRPASPEEGLEIVKMMVS